MEDAEVAQEHADSFAIAERKDSSNQLDKTSASSFDSDFNDLSSLSSGADDGTDDFSSDDDDQVSRTKTTLSVPPSGDHSRSDTGSPGMPDKISVFNDNSSNNRTKVPDLTREEHGPALPNNKKKLVLSDSLSNGVVAEKPHATKPNEKEAPAQSKSVFRRLGRFFFQGPTSQTAKPIETAHGIVPGTKISFKDGERDERWDFDEGMFHRKEKKQEISNKPKSDGSKKVLKLQISTIGDKQNEMYDEKSDSDDEGESEKDNISVGQKDALKQHCSENDSSVGLHFILCDADKHQCLEWQGLFENCKDVEIRHQTIFDCKVKCGAVVVPGNSFGFLDGEPEIQFTESYGWELQEDILCVIREEYDGELLVGQAVVTPIRMKDTTSGANCQSKNNHPKYAVYTPVMRVPLHVGDTVNAYLAFRAAIRAVNLHNRSKDGEEKIHTLLCPALCDGFGGMPPGRIASQMKTAYDAFASRRRSDLARPIGVGPMATNHVQMTKKIGKWC